MKFSFKKALCLLLTVCIMCSTFALPVFANTENSNSVVIAEGLTAEKLCSLRQSHTINPGRDITYTIHLENSTNTDKDVVVTDVLPETATLKEGCDNVDESSMIWNVTVPANGSIDVVYTLTVNSSAILGSAIDGSNAKVDGFSVDCYDIYIENTFGEVDNKKIISSIDTLNTALVTDTELAKTIYNNATSFNIAMTETSNKVLEQIYVTGFNAGAGSGSSGGAEEMPDIAASYLEMIAPTLYGGTKVSITPDKYFRGEPNPNPTKEDLMIGDLLFLGSTSSANVYIYNGDQLVKLVSGNFKEVVREDVNEVLAKAVNSEMYVVLRPSFVLTAYHQSTPEFDENLSEAQKAVIYTALAYQRRGYRVQYADSVMNLKEYRWQHSVNSPESYTQDNIQYTNCAAFCNDVYINAIGYNEEDMYRTDLLRNCKKTVWKFTRATTQEHSAEEKAKVEKEFYDNLQPGDIINIRYTTSSGHAMLYVGNGTIIHSAGSKINYGQVDTIETSIKVMRVAELWTPDNRRYIFSKCSSINIVRPLKDWNGEIPQNTKNRITTMMGIVGEKLSSKNEYTSVNPGDEITYTFSVYNTNEEAKTLEILDTVPANTSFVSGVLANDNGNLSYTLTVGANETKTVSYTVKVNEDAPNGTRIVSNSATIGGVIHPTHEILVAKTLTDAQQTQITTAYNNNKSTLSGVALANKIYKDVLDVEKVIHHDTVEDILGNLTRVVSNGEIIDGVTVSISAEREDENYYFELDKSYYKDMVVPKFMNGRYVFSTQNHSDLFTRLPREAHLIPGDIIVSKTSSASTTTLYMYSKEGLINLTNKTINKTPDAACQQLLGNKCFVLLRPSMASSYEYTEPEKSQLEILIEELDELNKTSITDDASLATFEAKVAAIDAYLAENPTEELSSKQQQVYAAAKAKIDKYKNPPVIVPEDHVEAKGKIWFALGGNSKFFVKTDEEAYLNRANYTNFLPGVDFAGTLNTATGIFATDQKALTLPAFGGSMFAYTVNANNTSVKNTTVADFTLEDGNYFWTIDGTEYLVRPNNNVIKISRRVTNTKAISDQDTKDRYASVFNGTTIDVPDKKYESLGFLPGSVTAYLKFYQVTLYYSDGTTDVQVKKITGDSGTVKGDNPNNSTDTYKEGVVYLANFLDTSNQRTSRFGFVPWSIDVNPTKTLTSIKFAADAKETNGDRAAFIISAWGVEKVVTIEELITELKDLNSAADSDFDAIKEKVAEIDEFLAKNSQTASDLTAEQKAVYDEAVNKIANIELSCSIEIVYKADSTPYAKVTINNKSELEGKPYKVIIVYIGENNVQLGRKIVDGTSTKDLTKSYEIEITDVPAGTKSIKGLIWKDFATLLPLAR